MMNNFRLISLLTLGIAAGCLSLPQQLNAASLTTVSLEESNDWVPHIWQIYLRAGGASWEASVRPHPVIVRNSVPGDPQADVQWPAYGLVPWELQIEGTTLIFSIGNETLNVSQIDGKSKVAHDDIFDGLKLWASATTIDGRVSEGTEAIVNVMEVNGMTVTNDVSCSATASILGVEQSCQTAYISSENITSLKGFAGMLWKDGLNLKNSNPQSHVQIFIEAFHTEHEIATSHTATPEPLTILGTITASGFGAFFKQKLNKRRNDDN